MFYRQRLIAVIMAGVGVIMAVAGCNTSQTVTTAAEDTTAQAFSYYTSPARRAFFRQVGDEQGQLLINKMLSGEIPSITQAYNSPNAAPANGYGVISSKPSGITPASTIARVSVVVYFSNGAIDTTKGIAQVRIDNKSGGACQLINTALTTTGQPIANSGEEASWIYLRSKNTEPRQLYIVYILPPAMGTPVLTEPLLPNGQYHIAAIGYGKKAVNSELIQREDASFAEALRSSCTWPQDA